MRERTQPVVMSLRSSPTGYKLKSLPGRPLLGTLPLNSYPSLPPQMTLNPSVLHAFFTLVLILLFVCLFRLKPES